MIEIGDVKIDTAARQRLRAAAKRWHSPRANMRLWNISRCIAAKSSPARTLYEHLFDENDSTLSNLLDVHVSNVRKKLGAEFIVTRRGHGYCIE